MIPQGNMDLYKGIKSIIIGNYMDKGIMFCSYYLKSLKDNQPFKQRITMSYGVYLLCN